LIEATAVQASDGSVELTNSLAMCQIFSAIPTPLIDDALKTIDRTKHRLGKFPDHLVVYFVIFMALFSEHSYLQIFEFLRSTLSWLSGYGLELDELSDTAIAKARRRIGFEPLEKLFKITSAPVTEPNAPGAFFHNFRLCLLDGTVLDAVDSPDNQILGKRKNQNGEGAYPQFRVVALVDYATRVIADVEIATMVGNGEVTLAKILASRLTSDLLILADRNFPGTELCRAIVERNSHFVFRVKASLKLTPIDHFEDGSYTAFISEKSEIPLMVRVFEYTLEGSSDKYKIITSLLDAEKYTALDLGYLYPHRWTVETILGDVKVVLKTQQILLRSKSPSTAAQEIFGIFLAYNVVRSVMQQAAQRAGVPPSHLSFRHSVKVLKFSLPKAGDFSP
jgi:L-fucose mutarotase/ribose pyranase (RbsD/FucU family)